MLNNLSNINDIFKRISEGDEKCLNFLLDLNADLFLSYTTNYNGADSTLFVALLTCEKPDFFLKVKNKMLESFENSNYGEDSKRMFYQNIIQYPYRLFRNKDKDKTKREIENIFDLLIISKTAWNIEIFKDLYEEAKPYIEEKNYPMLGFNVDDFFEYFMDNFYYHGDSVPSWFKNNVYQNSEEYLENIKKLINGIVDLGVSYEDLTKNRSHNNVSVLEYLSYMDDEMNKNILLPFLVEKFNIDKKDNFLLKVCTSMPNSNILEYLINYGIDLNQKIEGSRYNTVNEYITSQMADWQEKIKSNDYSDKEKEPYFIKIAEFEKILIKGNIISNDTNNKYKNRL